MMMMRMMRMMTTTITMDHKDDADWSNVICNDEHNSPDHLAWICLNPSKLCSKGNLCALSQCCCKMLTLQCWIIGGEMECWALVISVLHPRLPFRFGMPKLQMHAPGHRSWCISANNGSHYFQVGTGFTLLANGYQPNSNGLCNAWTACCILHTCYALVTSILPYTVTQFVCRFAVD